MAAAAAEPEPSLIEKVKEAILPSGPTTAEPEAKDLDVPAAEESDSEDEAPAVATAKEVGTPVGEPTQAAASIAPAPVNGVNDSKVRTRSRKDPSSADPLPCLTEGRRDQAPERRASRLAGQDPQPRAARCVVAAAASVLSAAA